MAHQKQMGRFIPQTSALLPLSLDTVKGLQNSWFSRPYYTVCVPVLSQIRGLVAALLPLRMNWRRDVEPLFIRSTYNLVLVW